MYTVKYTFGSSVQAYLNSGHNKLLKAD